MSLPHESSGVQLIRAAQMSQIVNDLAQRLSCSRHDPFASDLVIVPDAGTGRVISQELARHLGTSGTGDGVCAGISFPTISSWLRHLNELIMQEPFHHRPWHPHQLPLQIARALSESYDHDWAYQLHIQNNPDDLGSGPGRRMYRAKTIARLYQSYLRDCPELLAQWAEGKNTDNPHDQWQAELWRVLLAQFGADPVSHHKFLVETLRAAPAPGLPHEITIIANDYLATSDKEIIDALGTHHSVVIYFISTQLRGLSAEHCDAFGSAESTLQKQWSMLSTTPPQQLAPKRIWNPRITLHQCYGPDRQVEVLRDALLRILSEKPEIEPRDIVIHCADIATFAPLITSAFAYAQDPTSPGAQLRVKLAVADPNQPNPIFSIIDELLVLSTTRALVTDIFLLLSQPVVMARFGWTQDNLQRIKELITMAQIRWGIDQNHCQLFDIATEQNTWSAGIDRLIAGIALDETVYSSVGRALPLDDVSAQDVPLIGALADIISVLKKSISFTQKEHSLSDWLQHCRTLLTSLVSVVPDAASDLAQIYSVLSDLAEITDCAITLSLGDFRVLLHQSTPSRAMRTMVGTGSLIITSATQLIDIPRKVTVLLGFDDGVFPHPEKRCGDDLRYQHLGSSLISSVTHQRTALLRAATATDDVIVICQHRHPLTNHTVPQSGTIGDLVNLARSLGRAESYQHPLQRFSPDNFTGKIPRSFDSEAYAGAQALITGIGQLPPIFDPELHEIQDKKEIVTLSDLCLFFDNPVKAFLRDRIGISTFTPEQIDPNIPITPDALDRWSVGTRLLELLKRGYTEEEALVSERLRGTIPPRNLGSSWLAQISSEVRAISDTAAPYLANPYRDHVADLGLDGIRLSGVVSTYGNEIVDIGYSRVSEKHLLRGWLSLLVLNASEPGNWRWRMIGKRSQAVIGPIPTGWSTARGLERLIAIARYGQTRPLPVSPRISAQYARTRKRAPHLAPQTSQFLDHLRRDWSYDQDGLEPFYPTLESLFTDKKIPEIFTYQQETTLAGALAMLLWNPILELQENL